MRIEVDGVEYSNFVSADATLRLDALSNTFSFEATAEDAIPLPFKGGEACKVSVDGEQVLAGFIELVNVDGGPEDHSIALQGRDRTGDILDSSIAGGFSDLGQSISLKRIIERVIAHLDPDTPARDRIQVVDEVNPARFNKAEDLAAPEPGQNAFEFIESKARKRQVLLTSDADGNVVISLGTGVEVEAFVQHRIQDNTNNVLSYSASFDTTGRFNVYQTVSQLNPTAFNFSTSPTISSLVSQGGKSVVDALIRKGRQHVLVSENMSSGTEDEKRTRWEKNIRKARGQVYSAVVTGYRNQTGNLWAINELIQVVDEYAGIPRAGGSGKMLVNSVTFSLTGEEDAGRTTTLSLVQPDAYSLALEEPVEEELGGGLTFP